MQCLITQIALIRSQLTSQYFAHPVQEAEALGQEVAEECGGGVQVCDVAQVEDSHRHDRRAHIRGNLYAFEASLIML